MRQRQNIKMGKRGLSPLIATVVLIAFAVSLGAVVMNLGSNIAKNQGSLSEPKECAGLKMRFHDLNGPQVTLGGQGAQGFIEFVIDNVGTESIPLLRVTVIGNRQGSAQTFVSDVEGVNVQPGVPFSKRVAYNYDSYGAPKQVLVFPLAQSGAKKVP